MRSSDWIRNEPKPKISQVPKSFRKPTVERPETCCGNCRHWRPPFDPDKDEHGTCRVVVTLTRRIPRGPEKGTCVPLELISRTDVTDYDMMRTRDYFAACELYVAGFYIEPEPDGYREKPVQGRLFDRVAERREVR